MTFTSILFRSADADTALPDDAPAFFTDLNFDAIVAAATRGRNDYKLRAFFYQPLTNVEAIDYRHAVFGDLESGPIREHLTDFGRKLHTMRQRLAEADKARYKHVRVRWFIDAVSIYCEAVQTLQDALTNDQPASDALRGLCQYLTDYTGTRPFTRLVETTDQLLTELAAVHYCVLINGEQVTVTRYDDQPDYGGQITETFERFRQGASSQGNDEQTSNTAQLNRIEASILENVVKLYPDTFKKLDAYCENHREFIDDVVARVECEIQFYLGYHQLMRRITAAGLEFCYPQVSDTDKSLDVKAGFDLALADKLVGEWATVIPNDVVLEAPERIIIVTGPNQGGKTTFARMFGQLHHLARLGCPVPGQSAKLLLCSHVLTHFERPEATQSLRGKLEDELHRMHAILEQADGQSVIVANEIFGSTTSRDAQWLGEKVLGIIDSLDALCVVVTFIDELAAYSEHTVSMVSTVEPDDPTCRTFKVVRRAADGLAYARSLAEQHRLTRTALRERL